MSEIESFRQEARAWLEENAPKSLWGQGGVNLDSYVWGGKHCEFPTPDHKRWLEVAAEKGWTAPTWPTEYGGGGLDKAQAKVIGEEMARIKLPPPLSGFGLTMIGPTLLRFGNEEQKKEHLTKICRGEIRWCQGYSEPGAGSDLANVQTRGVREGDEFVVNGQKVWTSYGDLSDWIFALVRTDANAKKQEGISFVLIDMETPGVTVRPIKLISGKSPFCETYFEDVRVPVKNVVHEINAGWTVAKALLGHERSMIGDVFGGGGSSREGRGELVEFAARQVGEHDGRLGDALLRSEIAQSEMDTRAFGLTVKRTRDAAKAGQQPGPESSIFKIAATEANQRRLELMVRIAGPQGLGWEGEGFEDDELAATRDWLRSRGNTIEGGTSEIQLNIIAKHVLGLPD